MSLTPVSSALFGDMFSTPAMRALWTDERTIASWMQVERTVTRVQAEMGLVPADAARVINETLRPGNLPPELIEAKKASIGHLFVAFLKAFHDVCGDAAAHLHLGLTTQDVLDTGLVLQMRDAYALLYGEALALESLLCDRAEQYAGTPVMGRSHEQHAVPVTFGFVVAGWAVELRDHLDGLRGCEKRWMVGNISGAVGAHNAFVELAGHDAARRIEREVCMRLGLERPLMPLHPRIDRFSELVDQLAALVGFLGRLGLSIRSMQRTELGEVEEPYLETQHWSSTMPNKKNPEACEQVAGLASLCRGLAHSLQEIRVADYRDSTRLPVLVASVPSVFMAAARSVDVMQSVMDGLIVNQDRMSENLNEPHSSGQAAAERVMIRLYKETRMRDAAYEAVRRCAREAREQQIPLADVLKRSPGVARHLGGDEIDALCNLSSYTGTASSRVADALSYVRARNAEDRGDASVAGRNA